MPTHITHIHAVCSCSKFHTCHCWSGDGSRGFGGSATVCSRIVSEIILNISFDIRPHCYNCLDVQKSVLFVHD